MRIAIFSDTFFPQINGVAAEVYNSAKMLATRDHDVLVLTVSKQLPAQTIPRLRIVNLLSIPAIVYKGERLYIPYGAAYRETKSFHPDLIHTHTPLAVGLEAVVTAKLLRVPLVGTHHTLYDHYLKYIHLDHTWMKNLSWKLIVSYYNKCLLEISPSRALADQLIRYGLKSLVKILPYVIDTDLFQPVSAERKNQLRQQFGIRGKALVYMGRLSYEKSIPVVIKAFKLVQQKIPDTKLLLVGDGPERNNLEKLVRELEIEHRVVFTGVLRGKQLAESLQASDIFVTASKSENLPISLLEGISAGLPGIVVNANGLPEVIENGVNGFLTTTDDVQEMADRITELLQNNALLARFAQASRQKALQYSSGKIAEALEATYIKAMKLYSANFNGDSPTDP